MHETSYSGPGPISAFSMAQAGHESIAGAKKKQDSMAQLAYRSTFLDVLLEDEERAQDPFAGRAQSAPPIGCGRARLSPDAAAVHAYVQSLSGFATATRADSAEAEDGQEPLQSQEVAAKEPVELSAGSLGHPVLCQRPCVHTAAGRWECCRRKKEKTGWTPTRRLCGVDPYTKLARTP